MSIGFYMMKSLLSVSIAGLSILLLAGGTGCTPHKHGPKFTSAEQAEINKFCKEYGSDVKAVDVLGETLLYKAAYEWDVAVVKYLVSKGADVNVNSRFDGVTPLASAASNKDVEVAKFLVSEGADVNAKDRHDRTPLHVAAHNRNVDVAGFFVSEGIDVNVKNHNGVTPLHKAADRMLFKGDRAAFDKMITEMTTLLVSQGADVNAKDKDGATPLDLAKKYGNTAVVEYLSSVSAP